MSPKQDYYSNRSNLTRVNIVDSVFRIADKYSNVIFLAGGTPPFPLPTKVWDDICAQAKSNVKLSQYTHNIRGDSDLRRLIAEDLSNEFGYAVNEEEILLTVGTSAATFATLQALVDPGDEVLWTSPGYPGNIVQIKLSGGNLIEVPLIEKDNWRLDTETIQKSSSDKTKLFIYAEPLNPTGTIFSEAEKQKLLQTAESKDFFILADETYRHIIYPEANFKSIMTHKESKKRVILLRSFSKDFSMSGLRLGYIYTDKKHIERIEAVHIAMNICASSFAQEMAKILMKDKEALWSMYSNEYDKRRKTLTTNLDQLNDIFTYNRPMGGFFIFAKYNHPSDSMHFFELLLKSAQVAVMPGIAFGSAGEHHVRISYTNTSENITDAFERIKKAHSQGKI